MQWPRVDKMDRTEQHSINISKVALLPRVSAEVLRGDGAFSAFMSAEKQSDTAAVSMIGETTDNVLQPASREEGIEDSDVPKVEIEAPDVQEAIAAGLNPKPEAEYFDLPAVDAQQEATVPDAEEGDLTQVLIDNAHRAETGEPKADVPALPGEETGDAEIGALDARGKVIDAPPPFAKASDEQSSPRTGGDAVPVIMRSPTADGFASAYTASLAVHGKSQGATTDPELSSPVPPVATQPHLNAIPRPAAVAPTSGQNTVGAGMRVTLENAAGLDPIKTDVVLSAAPTGLIHTSLGATTPIAPISVLNTAAAVMRVTLENAAGLDPIKTDVALGAAPTGLIHGSLGATTPIAMAPQPVPVHVNALAAQITTYASQGQAGTVELALAPEELGKIKLILTPDGDNLRVVIQAERAETMELLRRSTDGLLADMRQSGFANTSLSFGGWGDGDDAADQRNKQSHAVLLNTEPEQPTPHQIIIRKTSGLDLRV
jgi:hypothetical protein